MDIDDGSGNQRKLGLLAPSPGMVKASRTWETDNQPMLTDDEVRNIITDPHRTSMREMFDDHWVAEGDQQNKGSCNGWATASVVSKTRWLQGIRDGVVLSGSYVYSWINNGQDNGSNLADDVNELTLHGTTSAKNCGPQSIFRSQTKQFDADAAKHKGLNFLPIDTIQGLKSAVAKGFLVVVAVEVGNNFQRYKSGVLNPDSGSGNHAIHCDDLKWDGSRFLFDCPNNWNLTFGERGRVWLPEQAFSQTMSVHQFWALMSIVETP